MVEANLNTEKRWLLEGHKLKANDPSYVKTPEKELLAEYEKAIDLLTIDPTKKLERELKTTKAKQDEIAELRSVSQDLMKQVRDMQTLIRQKLETQIPDWKP